MGESFIRNMVDKVYDATELDSDDGVIKAGLKGFASGSMDMVVLYGVVAVGMLGYAIISGKKIGFIDKE